MFSTPGTNLPASGKAVISNSFCATDSDKVFSSWCWAVSPTSAVKSRNACSSCHHDVLVEGKLRGAGLVNFVPKKTKFWTLKDSFIQTTARMCTRCGAISWYGDTAKLSALRAQAQPKEIAEPPFSEKEAQD